MKLFVIPDILSKYPQIGTIVVSGGRTKVVMADSSIHDVSLFHNIYDDLKEADGIDLNENPAQFIGFIDGKQTDLKIQIKPDVELP